MALRIVLIEPYYGGSHRAWVDGYVAQSEHRITPLTLPANYWKWRMQGGAVTLARLYNAGEYRPDLIVATEMFNLATFRALTRQQTAHIPIALYFQENQLTYPQNTRQNHGWRYAFINYISALAADRVFFNSDYHYESFFATLPNMLKHFPEYNELETIEQIRGKSSALPLGLSLKRYDAHQSDTDPDQPPLLLWNHRWEEDKNPSLFFDVLRQLADDGVAFRVALLGENTRHNVADFEAARAWLGERVVHYGYAESFADYARLLWQADYQITTAYQDFFGGAVAEAIYCRCVPLLPRRLNYPSLVATSEQAHCLYGSDDDLLPLLRRHLTGAVTVDTHALRKHVAGYDWSLMARRYDAAFTSLMNH